MPSVSQKQANLMSAIKHGWHPPAGMHAPSLAVAREFHAADKREGKFMHAEGGKITNLDALGMRISQWLAGPEKHRLVGTEPHPTYLRRLKTLGWDPKVTKDEISQMSGYTTGNLWGWAKDSPYLKSFDDLITKYGIRPGEYLYRGLALDPEYMARLKPGDVLRSDLPQSYTRSKPIAEEFSELGEHPGDPAVLQMAPSKHPALPLPFSDTDEFAIHSGDRGAVGLNRVRYLRSGTPMLQVERIGGQSHPDEWNLEEILAQQAENDKNPPPMKHLLDDLYRTNPESYYELKKDPGQVATNAQEHREILAHEPEEGYAGGGSVDITDPKVQADLIQARATPMPSRTEHFLNLVSHAADRATSTVTDDPHHALARVASGLASQVAGRAPSGRLQFGRLPNLVDEVKSLPAGMADLGVAGSNILGALSDKYLPKTPGDVGYLLSHLRDATNAYVDKHGDPAPASSRAAEARSNATHAAVNQAMGLSAPRGFTENLADATGTMLGQIPIPLGEAKTGVRGAKGALSALARAIPEYLGPTIRPSVRNYATGALGGGALGALASPSEDTPLTQTPSYGTMGPMARFEARGGRVTRYGDGGKVDLARRALLKMLGTAPILGGLAAVIEHKPAVITEGGSKMSKLGEVSRNLAHMGHTPESVMKELAADHAVGENDLSHVNYVASQYHFDPAKAQDVYNTVMRNVSGGMQEGGNHELWKDALRKFFGDGDFSHFDQYADDAGAVMEDFHDDLSKLRKLHSAVGSPPVE